MCLRPPVPLLENFDKIAQNIDISPKERQRAFSMAEKLREARLAAYVRHLVFDSKLSEREKSLLTPQQKAEFRKCNTLQCLLDAIENAQVKSMYFPASFLSETEEKLWRKMKPAERLQILQYLRNHGADGAETQSILDKCIQEFKSIVAQRQPSPSFAGQPLSYYPRADPPYYLLKSPASLWRGGKDCRDVRLTVPHLSPSSQKHSWYSDKDTAQLYAKPWVCEFKTQRDLKLMPPTWDAFRTVLAIHPHRQELQELASFAFGEKKSRRPLQCQEADSIARRFSLPIPEKRRAIAGGRCSYDEVDRVLATALCESIHDRNVKLDGFLNYATPSAQGKAPFHPEVMLCDPSVARLAKMSRLL